MNKITKLANVEKSIHVFITRNDNEFLVTKPTNNSLATKKTRVNQTDRQPYHNEAKLNENNKIYTNPTVTRQSISTNRQKLKKNSRTR